MKKPKKPVRRQKNIQKLIDVHMVEGGWIHTHGMAKLGLPELELKHVPFALAPFAADLLNQTCDYLINSGRKVSAGETMQCGPCVFQFKPAKPSNDPHYKVEVWELADMPFHCDECNKHEKAEILN